MQLGVYLSSHDIDKVWCQHKWCPLSLETLHSEEKLNMNTIEIFVRVRFCNYYSYVVAHK